MKRFIRTMGMIGFAGVAVLASSVALAQGFYKGYSAAE